MKLSVAALFAHAKTPEGRKQLRYAGVSVVFVPLGQILIQILGRVLFLEKHGATSDPNFTKASLANAAILTLPNFFANKYIVWRDANRENLKTQVAVFWVAAMLGTALATLLTFGVEKVVKHFKAANLVQSIAVFFAQLVGFGIVWVLRYLVLDKWIFKKTHHQ